MEIEHGFEKIAVSENNMVKVTAYFQRPTKQYLFTVEGKADESEFSIGPVRREYLPMIVHCIQDVYDMRGKCYAIKE